MLNIDKVEKALKRGDKGGDYSLLDILAICEGIVNAKAQKAILEIRKAEQKDVLTAQKAADIIETIIIGGNE